MHKELRKYSSIGNTKGIILLCKKVLSESKVSLSSVKTSCSFITGCDLNFKCGILALEALGHIKVENDICEVHNPFFSNADNDSAITKLCQSCFTYLISEGLVRIDLLKFNEQAEMFYIPRGAFSLNSAIFRNLLISFKALIPYGNEFRISPNYDSFFNGLIRKVSNKLTLEELEAKLKAQQEMGEKGELFVLEFEGRRCDFSDDVRKRIRQISHIDVSAGYDIISFHDESASSRRYIEVKTYSGKPHFYWSANEINSAKLRREDYFIYLVDINLINKSNYTPTIISNPYKNILSSEDWVKKPSSYHIERREHSYDVIQDDSSLNAVHEPFQYDEDDSIYLMAAEP